MHRSKGREILRDGWGDILRGKQLRRVRTERWGGRKGERERVRMRYKKDFVRREGVTEGGKKARDEGGEGSGRVGKEI